MIKQSKPHSDHLLDALVYGFSFQKVEPMGCDIHWYSETKKNGTWVCDQAETYSIEENGNGEGRDYIDMHNFPDRGRDYWWFGFIQPCVRTEWEWSFPERIAFPEDASPEIAAIFEQWGPDAHSEGYLTRAELKAKLESLREARAIELINPGDMAAQLKHFIDRLQETIKNLNSDVPDTDQRIIFWFDN